MTQVIQQTFNYLKPEEIQKIYPEVSPSKLRRYRREGFLIDIKPIPPKCQRYYYSLKEIEEKIIRK